MKKHSNPERSDSHLRNVRISAKYDRHLIRPCTECGTMHKASHYFHQHCEPGTFTGPLGRMTIV